MYLTSNKVVLDKYIHFILDYFEHNADDEPYEDRRRQTSMRQ